MTIDFTCQKCEASFELDAEDLIDGTEKLACPHCDIKAPPTMSVDFVTALTEMRAQVATLAKRFTVSMAIETEDLEDEIPVVDKDDDAVDEDDPDADLDEDDEDDDDDEEEELEDEDADER